MKKHVMQDLQQKQKQDAIDFLNQIPKRYREQFESDFFKSEECVLGTKEEFYKYVCKRVYF